MFDGLRVIWISIQFISVTIHLLYRSLVLSSPRATTNLTKIVELDRVTSPLLPFEVCGRPVGSYLSLELSLGCGRHQIVLLAWPQGQVLTPKFVMNFLLHSILPIKPVIPSPHLLCFWLV